MSLLYATFMEKWNSKNRHKYLLQYHVIFVCKYRKKLLAEKQISDILSVVLVMYQGRKSMLCHYGRRKCKEVGINRPCTFFETYGYPLLIDEFQREPNILLEMKKIIDQKNLDGEDTNGMFRWRPYRF